MYNVCLALVFIEHIDRYMEAVARSNRLTLSLCVCALSANKLLSRFLKTVATLFAGWHTHTHVLESAKRTALDSSMLEAKWYFTLLIILQIICHTDKVFFANTFALVNCTSAFVSFSFWFLFLLFTSALCLPSLFQFIILSLAGGSIRSNFIW